MTSARVAASTARRLLAHRPTLDCVAGPSVPNRSFVSCSVSRAYGRAVPVAPDVDLNPKANAGASKETSIKNEAIRSRWVRLVDPKTNQLAGPFNTRHLLNKLDTDAFYLQQVVAPRPDQVTVGWDDRNPPTGGYDVTQLVQFPVCKLVNKKEEIQKQVERRVAKKALKAEQAAEGSTSPASLTQRGTSKEVHISWNTMPHDLLHKLGHMKTQMLKGARINVLIEHKERVKPYTPGKDPKRDQEYHRLITLIDQFMCKKVNPTATELKKIREEIDPAAPLGSSSILPSDDVVAIRSKDVEWKNIRGTAFLQYDMLSRS